MTGLSMVGQSIERVDGLKKALGFAHYTEDLDLGFTLIGEFLGSCYAYAKIINVDLSAARNLPGVFAAICGNDLTGSFGSTIKDRPALARDYVRYLGEPVAAVAACDRQTALKAIDLIKVEYEPLIGVFDAEQAAQNTRPLLHPQLAQYQHVPIVFPVPDTNICHHFRLRKGDVEAAFATADYIFEDSFMMSAGYHACLETHNVIAQLEDGDILHLWVSNQSPYVLQQQLAALFSWPEHKIRVSIPYLGGGFGAKIYPSIEPIAAALAMHTHGKRVKIALERDLDFTNSVIKHPAKINIKSGVNKNGTIMARQVTSYWDTGAYADCGPLVVRNSGYTSAGPYRIDNIYIDAYCVYTNNPVAGAFRGYGVPQVTTAYECHMDKIAMALDKDPLQYRLEQILQPGDRSATGEQLQVVGLQDCLEKAAAAAGWQDGVLPPAENLGDGKYRCWGLACSHKASQRHYPSFATVCMYGDGTAEVNCSVVDMGQGAATVFSQIAAEELGIQPSDVHINLPDTFITPYDRTTSASRGTFHGGIAVRAAAVNLRHKLCEAAARIWGCPPGLIHLHGKKLCHENSGQSLTVAQVLQQQFFGGSKIAAQGASMLAGCLDIDEKTGQSDKPTSFWMYAAHITQALVDTRTGKITVEKVYAAHDVGKAINPANCRQQIEGGVVMGIGVALSEELQIKEGRIINNNLHDYKMPTAMDAPRVEAILIENSHPEGPYGAVGLGEPPVGMVAPAIANSIYHLTGKQAKCFPLTPPVVASLMDSSEFGGE